MKKQIIKQNYWGYARVSTEDQRYNSSIETQIQTLIEYGVPQGQIITEVISGEAKVKPKLEHLCNTIPSGSKLVVAKLDRFARNTLTALKNIEELNDKGVKFIPLDISPGGDEATQTLIIHTFLNLAQFETARRRERQAQGIKAAKEKGKYLGRKSLLTNQTLEKIEDYVFVRDIKGVEVAKMLGISRSTLYKGIKIIKEKRSEEKVEMLVTERIRALGKV